jgi:hypothetical protein
LTPGASMNDARREEIRRALTLIEEAKGILEMALQQAAACCDDAISACQEVLQD